MRQTLSTPASPAASIRLVMLSLALMLAAVFAALPARAASNPEQWVQVNVEKGLHILNDKSLSAEKKRQEFRGFLLGLADVRRTAMFTLGAARRTASPAELNAFTEAFKNYAIAVYQTRLEAYSGQTLKVTGSTQRSPGDYVVTTVLVDPNGSSDSQPIHVDFRVDRDNGGFKVIDVSVVGVWLAIEERDQFSAFLAQHNNNVSALTKHLNELAKKLESSAPGDQASTH